MYVNYALHLASCAGGQLYLLFAARMSSCVLQTAVRGLHVYKVVSTKNEQVLIKSDLGELLTVLVFQINNHKLHSIIIFFISRHTVYVLYCVLYQNHQDSTVQGFF